MKREKFGSRLGFILISAGCAIGLGNVWRFPYITGAYGGAAFVFMFLLFLVILVLPIVIMEFSIGRASQKSLARALDVLEPKGTKWHWFKWAGIAGTYLLMMFYTNVAGWMLAYIPKMASGQFIGLGSEGVTAMFNSMLASPLEQTFWMVVVVTTSLFICSLGLKNGVERVTKVMMVALLGLIVVLVVRALMLPNAGEGVAFYLMPDFSKIFGSFDVFAEATYAAMGQAFFCMSVGMGSMLIFGSYLNKDNALTGEAISIAALNTFIAIAAGLVIFPACFAFGVNPDSGPGLVFVTLPHIFEQMFMGELWGALFFTFMGFAALSTVVAVFECILAFWMDEWNISRRKAAAINAFLISALSLPCILGFNVWSDVLVPGIGNIQDMEDFIVSSNVLPIGSLIFVLFCVSKRGWGWKNFLTETNTGKGMKFPKALYWWMKFAVPVLIVVIFIMGWIPKISYWIG